MEKTTDLIDQVMSLEAAVIIARDSLKETKLSRSEDIANVVDDALVKFKSSEEFIALFKKDHDTRFNVGVEANFYNIWTYYRDLDYSFFGSKLTDLIGEWLEEYRLNALDVALPPMPSNPSTRDLVEIEISLVETSEQPSVVEVDEVTVSLDHSIAPKVPIFEPNSSVTAEC